MSEEVKTTIQFKKATEWGQWARELGLKTAGQLRKANRLAAVATGRGTILAAWREAIEQGKARNWTKDEATNAFVRHLAKTGRGISRSTIYTWWENYEAGGIAALVDGRPLERLIKGMKPDNLATRAAGIAKALQDAGVRCRMVITPELRTVEIELSGPPLGSKKGPQGEGIGGTLNAR
jgi:hypothetical protein